LHGLRFPTRHCRASSLRDGLGSNRPWLRLSRRRGCEGRAAHEAPALARIARSKQPGQLAAATGTPEADPGPDAHTTQVTSTALTSAYFDCNRFSLGRYIRCSSG
jgi:hypothetical protein